MKQSYLFFILTLAFALIIVSCSSDPTPTPAPPTPTPHTVKALADISLHAGPGFDYDEVVQVSKQTPLALLGSALGSNCQDWVLVRTADGDEGWTAPVLVNVDAAKSTIPPMPTPTPAVAPTPMPSTCNAGLALIKVGNSTGAELQVSLTGAEPSLIFSVASGETRNLCLAPGTYCYDLTDGEAHERGDIGFDVGLCSCWHWGGSSRPASCGCSNELSDYQRP